MTPQTPPTDRALTAGEPLWMVHVLGPDEIYPAPDHATAVQWCAGMNGAIPGSDVLCVAVPALWTGSSKDHAAGLKDARDDFSALARPATSAASEVAPFAEGGIGHAMQERGHAYLNDYVLSTDGADYEPNEFERSLLEDFMSGLLCDEAMFGPVRALLAQQAALASPPVSERERELEGALRMAANRMDRLALEVQFDTRLRAEAADWVAEARALTAQPAGEGK